MKCKYKVRYFKSKGAFLILFWIGITTYITVSLTDFLPPIAHIAEKLNYGIYAFYVLLGIVAGPLTGWLADARCGNYKMSRFGFIFIFVGAVLNCLIFIIEVLVNDSVSLDVIGLFVRTLQIMGAFCCSVSLVQLGLDQMPDASSSSISSLIAWMIFSGILGGSVTTIVNGTAKNCFSGPFLLFSNYKLIWSLIIVFLMCCVLISDFCLSKKWLIIEPQCPNSLRTIYKVIKFAAKHKSPLNRSALTYWERDIPSRLDLGKSRYGGPFTTEQVEDVKTALRIIGVSLSIFLNVLSLLSSSSAFYHTTTYTSCTTYFSSHIFLYCILIWTLAYEFIFYPLLNERVPSSLSKIEIAIFFSVVITLVCLILKILSFIEDDRFNTVIEWIVPMLFQVSQGAILHTVGTSILEFICAQSPYSMRGLLTAYTFFVMAIADASAKSGNHLANLYFPEENSRFIVLLCIRMCLCTVALLLHCVIALRYKRRVRGDGYFAQAIVEEVYDRYLTARTINYH